MRQPKWTLEQVFAHRDWLTTDDHFERETPSDKDEYMFCIGHYFRPKGTAEEIAARVERSRVETEWLRSKCALAAKTILSRGEEVILQSPRDPTLDHGIKAALVISHHYSRRVIDYVLENPQLHLVWPILWHREIRLADLKMVSSDNRYSPFLQSEAEALLAHRIQMQHLTA